MRRHAAWPLRMARVGAVFALICTAVSAIRPELFWRDLAYIGIFLWLLMYAIDVT